MSFSKKVAKLFESSMVNDEDVQSDLQPSIMKLHPYETKKEDQNETDEFWTNSLDLLSKNQLKEFKYSKLTKKYPILK